MFEIERRENRHKKLSQEDGYTMILVLFCILLVLALGGLVIDGGRVMTQKIALTKATQSAAAAAVLNSYDVIMWEESGIISIDENTALIYASKYLKSNIPEANVIDAHVVGGSNSAFFVQAEVDVECTFMKIFHVNSTKVTASVTGKLN